jgi:hypothetical protein
LPAPPVALVNELPGIESAGRVLGLDREEIARAVQADPAAVDRWTRGEEVSAVFLQRLAALDALAAEIKQTMRGDVVETWLGRHVPAFGGRTPRQMIVAGHAEVVREALVSLNAGFLG